MSNYNLFSEVLDKLYHKNIFGQSITLTKENVAEDDNFLLFSAYDSHTITFKKRYDGVIILEFDHESPMLLEDCPDSFLQTLANNI